MDFILPALAGYVSVSLAVVYLSLLASLWHFRLRKRGSGNGPILPMTVIKPVKGLDEGLRQNFEALAEADGDGKLQVVIAMESEQDEAYHALEDFRLAHPDRDISLVITGPSGGRMGKMHNMIEALPHAKHPYVVFSDADVRASPELLRETSEAFRRGEEAIFALPYHDAGRTWANFVFEAAFNQYFSYFAALTYYLGPFYFCAGAWMAYSRRALEKAGGLEPYAHYIADDFALSRAVGQRTRRHLLGALARLRETADSWGDACRHLSKWSAIIRASMPRFYFLWPAANLGLMATGLWLACEISGRCVAGARMLLAATLLSRVVTGFLQDRWVGGIRAPMSHYAALVFADYVSLWFWLSGFRKEIEWRGKRYRLKWGGLAEVAAPSGAVPRNC